MVRQKETSRRNFPGRWLAFGLVAGLVMAGAGGCHRSSRPQPGGATSRKAHEARQHAEGYALAAVQGAAEAQVAAHPELDQRSGTARFFAKWNPWKEPSITVATTTQAPPAPPAAPVEAVPAPPAPPAVVLTTIKARPAPAQSPSRVSTGPMVIRERVVTEIPYPTESEAEERTLDLAAERIAQKLAQLDPPVEYWPSRAVVKNEYAVANSRVVRPPTEFEAKGINDYDGTHRVYVEYTVEMTADQIRELRTRDRVGYGFRVLGIVTAISVAGFLFLRLDEWTKGYLTSWLAFVAVALAGGVVAALIIV